MELPTIEFEKLVQNALEELPPYFQEKMTNVAFLVEPWPEAHHIQDAGLLPGHTLLGLYTGIPLTERTQGYHLVTPDTIILFQGPIEQTAAYETGDFPTNLYNQVRHTLIHEIAHHFGISDERLIELGTY